MISTFLDPTQLPSRTQEQKTFDILMGQLVQLLPVWGGEINATLGQFNAGMAGGAYALPYIFDASTTDADPGPNKLRLSSTTQNASATLRLDVVAGNVDVSSILDTFDASSSMVKGSIRLMKMGDQSKFLTFDVVTRAAPSGYRNLAVINTGGSGANPFVAGDPVLLLFTRNGDKGETGGPIVMHVCEQQANGSNSASATTVSSGVYRRVLNTVKSNDILGATLSGNQVTLSSSGKYRLRARAVADISSPSTNMYLSHKTAIYNVSDAAYAAVGIASTKYLPNTSNTVIPGDVSEANCVIAITSPKTFEVRTLSGVAPYSYGIPTGGGVPEIFTEFIIEKIG